MFNIFFCISLVLLYNRIQKINIENRKMWSERKKKLHSNISYTEECISVQKNHWVSCCVFAVEKTSTTWLCSYFFFLRFLSPFILSRVDSLVLFLFSFFFFLLFGCLHSFILRTHTFTFRLRYSETDYLKMYEEATEKRQQADEEGNDVSEQHR